jgi:PilZ domain
MSCFGKSNDLWHGRRAAARQRVMIVGSAVTLDGSKSILVENVSRSGAKLRGRRLPPLGKQVLVWMEGADALGHVAWTAFDQCGVAFDPPLEEGALAALP